MRVMIREGMNVPIEVDLEKIGKDVISIGRHPDSDIHLNSNYVSRVHACLYLENGSWNIEDLDSTCGLYYRGTVFKRMPIEDGTVIRIYGGEKTDQNCVEFRFRADVKQSAVVNQNMQYQPQQGYYAADYKNSNGHSLLSSGELYSQSTVPLGMTWYNILIWGILFLMALIFGYQAYLGLRYITVDTDPEAIYKEKYGEEYGSYIYEFADDIAHEEIEEEVNRLETVKTVQIALGILYFGIMIAVLLVRDSLAKFKEKGPKEYMILLYLWLGLQIILFMMNLSDEEVSRSIRTTSGVVAVINAIFTYANYVYFKKRKHMFVN